MAEENVEEKTTENRKREEFQRERASDGKLLKELCGGAKCDFDNCDLMAKRERRRGDRGAKLSRFG